jgi:hypothetical protein
MIVIRNTFRVKFGQAKPAVAALKQMREMLPRLGLKSPSRILTDLTGPSYTLVLEVQYDSLATFEQEAKTVFSNPEWRGTYEKFAAYVESGGREIYNVVD